MVTFDIKNDALALPHPLDYYVQNGLTSKPSSPISRISA